MYGTDIHFLVHIITFWGNMDIFGANKNCMVQAGANWYKLVTSGADVDFMINWLLFGTNRNISVKLGTFRFLMVLSGTYGYFLVNIGFFLLNMETLC